MKPFATTIPGYPRLGESRRYKKLLEGFWSGALAREAFDLGMTDLRADRLRTQAAAGLDFIPCGDFSLYDHVLDTAVMLGCVPKRFGWRGGSVDLPLYFALARGRDGVAPCEMTKWFDTNYHYLVPELPERFTLTSNRALEAYRFGRQVVGATTKPVLLGPFTFVKLARRSGTALAERLHELVPIYAQILRELAAEGATLAQVDEPALVGDVADQEWEVFAQCYQALASASGVGLVIQTYYGDVAPRYAALCALPVAGLGMDFVRGREGNLAAFRAHGFPADKVLAAGVVDGRNVWRTDLDAARAQVQELAQVVAPERLQLSASCSLLHLPETVEAERALPTALKDAVCFARERLAELSLLARALRNGVDSVDDEWTQAQSARARGHDAAERQLPHVRQRLAALTEADWTRPAYAERLPLQRAHLPLPPLPTTTIGSFPQTAELRRYPQQIGPGVYDVHSSNVPTVDFIAGKLWATLAILPAEQVWVNPDCGLKTRG
jgi:5-methyltetrahydropteroyltriglutamate--homocysteine methyltransferase